MWIGISTLKTVKPSGSIQGVLHAYDIGWRRHYFRRGWSCQITFGGGDGGLPFERANNGVSSDFYYNHQDTPKSLDIANRFVRWIHELEMDTIANCYDWGVASKHGLTVVDIGGHYGTVLSEVVISYSGLNAISMDLPEVIASSPRGADGTLNGVQLVAGDVFNASSIPKGDIFLMKHFLDRCMWSEDETVQILKNCRQSFFDPGKNASPSNYHQHLIIAEAVLPDVGALDDSTPSQVTSLHMDALYSLVGRERQRTLAEWKLLAQEAGWQIVSLASGLVPSCSVLVLEPAGRGVSETESIAP